MHVAVRFTERSFRLDVFRGEDSLDDDLGLRRHLQIDGLALYEPDRLACQAAGNRQLIHSIGDLLHRGVRDHRRRADDDRCLKGNLPLFAFVPMGENMLPRPGKNPDPIHSLDMAPVISDIANACLRILRHPMASSDKRCAVKTRSRDRDRELKKASCALQVVPFLDDLLNRPAPDDDRLNRAAKSSVPFFPKLFWTGVEAQSVDVFRTCHHTYGHGDIVAPPLGVCNLLEEKAAPLLFRQPAAVLPAHQRMHLRVLVDLAPHADEQPFALERGHVFMQIRVSSLVLLDSFCSLRHLSLLFQLRALQSCLLYRLLPFRLSSLSRLDEILQSGKIGVASNDISVVMMCAADREELLGLWS